jgi:hypothetical protein
MNVTTTTKHCIADCTALHFTSTAVSTWQSEEHRTISIGFRPDVPHAINIKP